MPSAVTKVKRFSSLAGALAGTLLGEVAAVPDASISIVPGRRSKALIRSGSTASPGRFTSELKIWVQLFSCCCSILICSVCLSSGVRVSGGGGGGVAVAIAAFGPVGDTTAVLACSAIAMSSCAAAADDSA